MRPPAFFRQEISAAGRARAPPFGKGQPTPWPSKPSISAIAEEPGFVSEQEGVPGQPGKQGPGWFVPEPGPVQKGGRRESGKAEAREQERMPWPMQHRLEQLLRQLLPSLRQWRHQRIIRCRIARQALGRGGNRAQQRGRRAAAQRMGQRDLRVDPFQAMPLQAQRAKYGRSRAKRMDGRAQIVNEAGQRQFRGAGCPAGLGLAFQDQDAQSRLRQHHRGRQAIRPGSDHHRIVIVMRHAVIRPGAPIRAWPPSPVRGGRYFLYFCTMGASFSFSASCLEL